MNALQDIEVLDLLNRIDEGYNPTGEELLQLRSKETFNLTGIKATRIPNSISLLTALKEFDVCYTGVTELPEAVENLKSLKKLYFGSNEAIKIPPVIFRLSSLEILHINNTNIAEIPDEIGTLSSLKILQANNTEIKFLPNSISQLSDLQILEIASTGISEIPAGIKQLRSLQTINVSYTDITVIPEWVGELPNLQYLNLSGLTLDRIPESLALGKLNFISKRIGESGINLFKCTLIEQNISIFLESPNLIRDLYNSQVHVRECKIIFLGDGGVGKSYTIKRFRNGGKRETDSNQYITSETPGVEILDYLVDRGEESFTIHFWDFGGQQLLHSMHRCFLTDNTCYIVTTTTRDNKAEERARYWLRNVTAFAPKSPILLFVNCWDNDDGKRSIDEPGLQNDFPMIKDVVYCSAKQADDDDFRSKVIDRVIYLAATSDGCSKLVPSRWLRVRQAIEEESKQKNYIDRKRYHELCKQNKIIDDQVPDLLIFFNCIGVCFSCHLDIGKKELAEYKLLNPAWLTNAIYAVIKEGKIHAKDGRISRAEIAHMLSNPAPENMNGNQYCRTMPNLTYGDDECRYIIDVAIANDLCYPVDDNTLFFPALCDIDTPSEALNVPKSFEHHVLYQLRYDYLPDSVLHQLMICCMRKRLSVERCWLRGVILYIGEWHRIIVRMLDDESLQIDIHSMREHRAYELFWILRRLIEEINRQMDIEAEEYIIDGRADFLLEDVVEAIETNGVVKRRGIVRNARELLGDFYEESIIQSMSVKDGIISIIPGKRAFTPCKKDNEALRHALYEEYKRACPYCGCPLSYSDMQVDHILPKSYPGIASLKPYMEYLQTCGFDINNPDYIENYFPAHGSCNRSKSNRVNEFTLPYWHLIAAHRASKVIERMKGYDKNNV